MSITNCGLYIHIPFCVKKCNYCDFASITTDDKTQDRYVAALIKEMISNSLALSNREISSVYIGGGTPTILNSGQINDICLTISDCYNLSDDVEFSIEMNPGTVTDELLQVLYQTKINRISVGIQSFNDAELQILGRIHDGKTAIETINKINPAYNVNIDLIFGLPTQTLESWKDTLENSICLKPDHISAYSLIVEERTKISAMLENGMLTLPDEEIEDEMYMMAINILQNAGYYQYEVSNFARIDKMCRHNIGYWHGNDYVGMGSSSVSYLNKLRYKNSDDVCKYCFLIENDESPIIYAERNSNFSGLMEETMLGLRMCEGFNLVDAENKWGCRLQDISRKYQMMLDEGLLYYCDANLKLSKEHFRFANNIIVELMDE